MDIDINLVEKSCGSNNTGVPFPDIGSDPNFIFQNDPLFSVVTLYDIEGNVINVNSWVECAHYVNGGWFSSVSDLINYEKRLFFTIIFVTVVFELIRKTKKL